MKEIYKVAGRYYRILAERENEYLIIDCSLLHMPEWKRKEFLIEGNPVSEEEMISSCNIRYVMFDELSPEDKRTVHERFTMIAPILPFIGEDRMKTILIDRAATEYKVSKPTIRKYLCQYLVSQQMESLAPAHRYISRDLSERTPC